MVQKVPAVGWGVVPVGSDSAKSGGAESGKEVSFSSFWGASSRRKKGSQRGAVCFSGDGVEYSTLARSNSTNHRRP